LANDALIKILSRALQDQSNGLGKLSIPLTGDQLERIAASSHGDARVALTFLGLLASRIEQRLFDEHKDIKSLQPEEIDKLLESTFTEAPLTFDKGGDHFYDQISALHKSVRGSSPDAALYWLARMLGAGCDPLYVARRVVRMASEDIGLADPRALQLSLNAWETQERLGSPEGELAIAQAVVYLSVAPKSNSVYQAWKSAQSLAKSHSSEPVPVHLRNAPTTLMKEMGHGKDYHYAHDYPEAYVAGEHYFPDAIQAAKLYQPTDRGLESKIQRRLHHWAMLDAQAIKD
jgi:putative ATPase